MQTTATTSSQQRPAESDPDDSRLARGQDSQRVLDAVIDQRLVGVTGSGTNREPDGPSSERSDEGKAALAVEGGTRSTEVKGDGHKCVACGEGFETKNRLHRHIRSWRHQWTGEAPSPGGAILSGSGRVASPTDEAAVAETHIDSVSRSHPGQKVLTENISEKDQQWADIGSGIFARTFKQTDKLRTTSRGGPCLDDIFRRKTWILSTGKVIDDCEINMVLGEVQCPRQSLYPGRDHCWLC